MATKYDKHWIRHRHKHWKECKSKWDYTWVHYSVDLDSLLSNKFLIQRTQGEHIDNYNERLATADYFPLFATSVDAIVGRIFEKEPIQRVWQAEGRADGLGSLQNVDSVASKLWKDANGRGDSYISQLYELGVKLVALHEVWVYVRGIPRDSQGRAAGEAQIHIVDPSAIVNWFEDDHGHIMACLMKTSRDMRTSIEDEPKEQDVYIGFYAEGTREFRVDPETDEVVEGPLEPYGEGFQFYRTKEKNHSILPIFRQALPLDRHVGYVLAYRNNVIFNQESERDNLLRIACTPEFMFVGTDEQFENAGVKRAQGANAIQLDPNSQNTHDYLAPPTGPADMRTKVLRDKVSDFFISTFRFYEDAVRGKQKTATEINQDVQGGEGSFLNTLAAALDSAENQIGNRLYQIYYPDRPEVWGQFHVERPRDFRPMSAVQEAMSLRDIIFGDEPIPIGHSGRLNAVKRIAEAFEIEFLASEVHDECVLREIGDSGVSPEENPGVDGEETEPVVAQNGHSHGLPVMAQNGDSE